jgi:hypothetical protein
MASAFAVDFPDFTQPSVYDHGVVETPPNPKNEIPPVVEDLRKLGWLGADETIAPADVATELAKLLGALLKDEVTLDPTGQGYAGKPTPELVELLNKPVAPKETPDGPQQSRWSSIVAGFPWGPNSVTEDMVKEAMEGA